MGGRVWDLTGTIISRHLLLATAHFLTAAHLRREGTIMASKCTHARRMFHNAHRHTHTLFKMIPWCHHSYFTNNGPHVCSGLRGCVRRGGTGGGGLGCTPRLKSCQVHCKFLFISSSCNLRPRCAGDCRNSQRNSLLPISFPYVCNTRISINHHHKWLDGALAQRS